MSSESMEEMDTFTDGVCKILKHKDSQIQSLTAERDELREALETIKQINVGSFNNADEDAAIMQQFANEALAKGKDNDRQ